MTAPVTLTVAQALVYAQTSNNPIIIQDSNANIAASADALVALGAQIVSLQGDGSTFSQALSAADLLALSSKTYYNGSLELFTAVNDTATNIAGNSAALASYAAGLAKSSSGLTLTINDTAANIATNATALQTLAAGLPGDTYLIAESYSNNSGYYIITSTDSYTYGNNNNLTLTISDTAADLAANAVVLQTLAAGLAQDTYLYNSVDNEYKSDDGVGGNRVSSSENQHEYLSLIHISEPTRPY